MANSKTVPIFAGTDANEVADHRFTMMLRPSEAVALDSYMFANRMRSRATAIRELLAYALEQKAKEGGAS